MRFLLLALLAFTVGFLGLVGSAVAAVITMMARNGLL